jgi:glutaredoxin-related protein
MEPPERPRPHLTETQRGDDVRKEALVGLPAIALGDEEAARFSQGA